MYLARQAQVSHLNLNLRQKTFYSQSPGKSAALALRVTIFEVLPKVNSLFPVQFEPPWC